MISTQDSLMMAVVYLLGYLYAFWFVYIGVMGIYRAHLDGRLSGVVKALCWPAVIVGLVMDIAANIFIATLVFVELPRELLVTTRLTRHMKKASGWRYKFAEQVCTHLLDVFDPTGKHCL